MLIGYARVSTTDQDTRMQLDALKQAGCEVVFHENGSSIGPRPQLQRALATLKKGDTLIVWKIDRLARSLVDLLILRLGDGTKEKAPNFGASLVRCCRAWCNRSRGGFDFFRQLMTARCQTSANSGLS